MIRYLSLFLFPAFIFGTSAYPQSAGRTVSGLVTSQEELTPLPGVLVYVKGTNNRSGTQQDGVFYIDVTDSDSVLVFQLDEFQTREVRLTQAGDYNIALLRGKSQPNGNGPFSPVGIWRAVFELKPGVTVPVNFDIRATAAGDEEAFFRNAGEEFDGGRVKVTKDSLFIFLEQFDNELAFRVGDTILTGEFRHQDKTGVPMPVRAERGVTTRFSETGLSPAGDLSGTYDIGFISGNGKEEKAVGLFRQNGNKLTATFLRVTGDSRYLEGIVEGNDFYLSSFIGGGPGLL